MGKTKLIFFFAIAAVLIVGWLTSTRHVDLQYHVDGQPVKGAEFRLFDLEKSEWIPVGTFDSEGWTRLPGSVIKEQAIYQIKFPDGETRNGVTTLRRGETTLNVTDDKRTISSFHYRFLFYRENENAETWIKDDE